MTTHVFIVDTNTFQYHLRYLFAGTGFKDKNIDFNQNPYSVLHPTSEKGLVGMMADGCRIRKNDLIIFYVQATDEFEGKFYGVFRAKTNGIFVDENDGQQYLQENLGKSLLFRVQIEPYEVYPEGVTEWQALDEIRALTSPNQMLWSLIYRKLKGNRGNTMITIYEADRLIHLIRQRNHHSEPFAKIVNGFDFDEIRRCIVQGDAYEYVGRKTQIDILPRLIYKWSKGQQIEAHLQMYITQNVGCGTNRSLDDALGITESLKLEWIGNEVSCGVGMQRMDIMLSLVESATKCYVMPVELKSVPASEDNTRQLMRYIDWIEQYYIPNRISIIQPVLICPKSSIGISTQVLQKFEEFNTTGRNGRFLSLIYIEFSVKNGSLNFQRVRY